MYYYLSYDVHSDKKRNKIAKYLKTWGYHLQKSVFIGNCQLSHDAEVIFREIAKLADLKTDSVFMAPMCAQCYQKRKTGGNAAEFAQLAWVL